VENLRERRVSCTQNIRRAWKMLCSGIKSYFLTSASLSGVTLLKIRRMVAF